MIKVRVTRAGLAGVSSFLALSSGLAACAVEPADDTLDTGESGLTIQNPGTGVFELAWAYGTSTGYTFAAKNSVDEFVRVGESMSFSLPAYYLWDHLHPSDPTPTDLARLQKLGAKVKVVFVKASGATSSKVVTTNAWTGTQTYDLVAATTSFTIPKGTQTVRFEVTMTDAADATKTAALGQSDFLDVPVIGGGLPDKTLLFDTDFGNVRQRVLEGGNAIAGANLAVAYTDWRAATLVDSMSLDRSLGTMTSYGRFGSFEMPITGEIQYEITCAAAIDGAWQADQALAANAKSRFLPAYGRTAYEGSVALPKGAKKLETYFHVKAYLVADYSKVSNVKWQRYQQGERILLAEKWDNDHGVAFHNYDFAIDKK